MPTPVLQANEHTTARLHRAATMMSDLEFIETNWSKLLDAGGSTGRAAAQSESRPPVDTHRLDLAIDITGVLHRWADLVVDERELTTAPLGTDVVAMAAFLIEHATWLAAHPIGSDAARELRAAGARLLAVVAPTGTRYVPLGPCPAALRPAETHSAPVSAIPAPRGAQHDNEAPTCPGFVYATLLGDGLDDQRDLCCDTNAEHRWATFHARHLAALMGDDTPERLTTTELATWLTDRYGAPVTASAIRGWRHRYPLTVRPDDDGTWDPIEIARWYVGWRAERAGR